MRGGRSTARCRARTGDAVAHNARDGLRPDLHAAVLSGEITVTLGTFKTIAAWEAAGAEVITGMTVPRGFDQSGMNAARRPVLRSRAIWVSVPGFSEL